MKSKFVKIVLLCLLLQPVCSVYANDNNPLRKLMRGVANLSLCWIELGRQPIKVGEDEGDISGATWGVAKGVGYTVGRAVLGAYELCTFALPPYRYLVEPEFILSNDKE